jgi:hypothetical protein
MSVAAVILAAAIGGGPAPAATETPNLYRELEGCGPVVRRVKERQREAFRQLGRLPRAHAEYAVARSVDDCVVPAPVGYHPDYLLPGKADAPPRREGAPSNRR